jgi:protein transport protein SEC24
VLLFQLQSNLFKKKVCIIVLYWINIGGRIIAFSSNLSSFGFGALKVRDEIKLYNTPNEKNILSPENDSYTKLAEECVKNRITVDLFITLPHKRCIDLASIAPLPNITGGDLNYFSRFDITKHGEKLHYLIYRIITRT